MAVRDLWQRYDDAQAFHDLVAREFQGTASPDEVAYLRADVRVVERWYAELLTMKADAETASAALRAETLAQQQHYLAQGAHNLSAKNAWFAYKTESESQRVKIGARLRMLQQRIVQVKQLRTQMRSKPMDDDNLLGLFKQVASARGKALDIFALKDYDLSDLSDDEAIELVVTVGDIRRARAALRLMEVLFATTGAVNEG